METNNIEKEKEREIVVQKEAVTQDNENRTSISEDGQEIFYNELNEYLKDYPIKYTESKRLNQTLERFCCNLKMTECESIIVLGDKGIGKTSLLYYYTEKVLDGDIPECTVLEISELNFPNEKLEIINDLIILAEKYQKKGKKEIIFFFDDFQKFNGSLWINYTSIVNEVVKSMAEGLAIKFVIALEPEVLDDNEQIARSVLERSLVHNLTQEIVPESIISLLQPRIEELMAKHSILGIDPKALDMIYGMEAANTVGANALSYKVYLTYIDKIMANFSYRGEKTITLKGIKSYYVKREYTGEVFKKKIKTRKEIARHEAGHTLIAMLSSEFLYVSNVTVISMTSTGTSGLTAIFSNPDTGWQTKENYIKFAAFYLAGRYAEKNFDVGAQMDIERATMLLRAFIMTTGLFEEFGRDLFIDPKDYEYLTNKKKDKLDKLVNKMLKKAGKYARKMLKKHSKFIKALSKELAKELFLSGDEVLKIWSKYK